jgi:hypothetical protein
MRNFIGGYSAEMRSGKEDKAMAAVEEQRAGKQ